MRMTQTIDDFESALAEQVELERQVAQHRVRQATVRTRRRHIERQNRHSTMRFVALVLTLLATAILVTIAMFQALYMVMG
jgi:predicted anti-sigma-YlaC factor YlaD